MFLWLDDETAVYMKIGEGIKLSLVDILEKLSVVIESGMYVHSGVKKIIDNKGNDFMMLKDFMPIPPTLPVFDEQDSFNLSEMAGLGKRSMIYDDSY